MSKFLSYLLKGTVLSMLVFAVGCDSKFEDSVEDAGENVEDTVEDAQDNVEDATD